VGAKLDWQSQPKRAVLNDDVKSHQRTCVRSPLAMMAKAIAGGDYSQKERVDRPSEWSCGLGWFRHSAAFPSAKVPA
jgi:hypothetical protein